MSKTFLIRQVLEIMTNGDSWFDKIVAEGILDNPFDDWIAAIISFFVYLLIYFFIKNIIIKRVNHFFKGKEEITKYYHIIKSLKETTNWKLGISLSLYFSLKSLTFSPGIDRLIYILIFGFIAFYLFRLLNIVQNQFFEFYKERRIDLRHLLEFGQIIVRGLIFIFISGAYLAAININITAYIASLTVLSLGIAFALQEILSDIFSSVILYFDKPFEIGDSIKIGDDAGKVEKIGLRSTHIRTLTGNLLVITNRELSTQRINNLTDMEERRVVLNVGVLCETEVFKLKLMPKLFATVINEVDKTHFSRAHFKVMNASSFDFEVVYFITSSDYVEFMDAQQEVNIKVLEMMEKEGIELAYPTRTIYQKDS